MRFRVIGRDEHTQAEILREVFCETQEEAEAFATFEGILVGRVERLPDPPNSPEPPGPSDRTLPTTRSADAARVVEAGSAPEFGHAPLTGLPARLDDPLRALRMLLGLLLLAQIALAVYALTRSERPGGALELWAGPILATFAFWRLLPNRRVNALYLRSFRHDADTWAMRRTLSAALGPGLRLSGIRDPRRRSIKLLRYLTVFLFALRYVTPKYMNLEAGRDWKRRLWRTLGDARLAIIDVSDLTPFVAEEIRLCARCLGRKRILFVGKADKDAEAYRAEINQVLDRPPDSEEVHLAVWRPSSVSERRAFEDEVRQFLAQVPAEPAGLGNDAFPLSHSAAPGLWTRLSTPLDLSEGWVWLELLLGLVLAGILGTMVQAQLRQALGVLTGRNPRELWLPLVIIIPVLGFALYELWLLLLYVKDCGRFRERCLTLVTFGLALSAPLFFAVGKVRESAARVQCASNLKQLAFALAGYADDHASRLPSAAICDPTGKPLLSWRVAVLPYLEQGELYKEFHLDEPWDGPHNLPLVERMPKVYAHPWASRTTAPGQTSYRVFVSPPAARPRAAFQSGVPTWIGLFADVPSQPILIVEAADAVPWTKPDELAYDPNGPLPKLGGHFSDVFVAVRTNGFVMFAPSATPEADLRGLIGIEPRPARPDPPPSRPPPPWTNDRE